MRSSKVSDFHSALKHRNKSPGSEHKGSPADNSPKIILKQGSQAQYLTNKSMEVGSNAQPQR